MGQSAALTNALKRRAELMAELAMIEVWLASYQRFAGEAVIRRKSIARRNVNGLKPKDIADASVAVVEASDRPVRRHEIVAALAARGIDISAKDPVAYVGIQLWRFARDRVRSVDRLGFVPISALSQPERSQTET